MHAKERIACRYDGTLDGFFCCVFHCYRFHEDPVCFFTTESTEFSLFPERNIATDLNQARRVYRSLAEKISPQAQRFVVRGFLSCAAERERMLFDFISFGYETGSKVMRLLGDERVSALMKAVQHLEYETHRLKGFLRFSEFDGMLAAEIEPKNRVLPLLRSHFCTRYAQDAFLIYDRTHREALIHQSGRWAILPLQEFHMAAPDSREAAYRALWRRFYDTIAIRERENPLCRMSHMPKRYWSVMTEFQQDGDFAAQKPQVRSIPVPPVSERDESN